MIKIATHNAKFHTDDVFAVATLLIMLGKENCEIARTRDEGVINSAEYVVDVGNIYDFARNRFDHHQIEGAGKRENGIPYASFGLVWKHFGEKVCTSRSMADEIDRVLVAPIDAIDNGFDISKPVISGLYQVDVNSIVNLFRPTRSEPQLWDEKFIECVDWAIFVIKRETALVRDAEEARQIVKDAYDASQDKRVIVVGEEHDLGREVVSSVLSELPEPLYAVLFRHDAKNWQVVAMRKADSMESKKPLPELWRGKRDQELISTTNVGDAVFCHRGGFMCLAGSKEGALELANKALNA